MPLDPTAKRLLTMMAAAAGADRKRPTPDERRRALAKLMQFARADSTEVATEDRTLPGPAGHIAYRLYAPAAPAREPAPGFVFFTAAASLQAASRPTTASPLRWRKQPAAG